MSDTPKRRRRLDQTRVSWTFEGGRAASLPLVELEEQLQRQYHAMAVSDDPILRMTGKRLAREAAEQAAAKQLADLQAAAIAQAPRPKARRPAKERVMAAMKPYKTGGTGFKTFMQAWGREPIDGLRLTPLDGDRYEIDDENADTAPTRYKASSLEKMYSKSAP